MSLWKLELEKYDKAQNEKYETLFTLANGYRGLRGSLEFSEFQSKGNFIAGIYDKSESDATELVNMPNPLGFNLYIEDEKIDFDKCNIEKFSRVLHLDKGVLEGKYRITTPKGKVVEIYSERYVSRSSVSKWATKYTIKSINFQGKILIENYIDGNIVNNKEDEKKKCKHFDVTNVKDLGVGIALEAITYDNKIKALEATALVFDSEYSKRIYKNLNNIVLEAYEDEISEGETKEIFKYGISINNRKCEKQILKKALDSLKDFIEFGYTEEKKNHEDAWKSIWERADIKIHGDEKAQLGMRFNLFHLSSCAYEGDNTVSIGAKGIHGEGYRGHVFWDTEVFMLPFFTYSMPEVAKSLLLYRYNTIDGARKNAKRTGYLGARFPWESADDGSEATPSWGYDFDGSIIKIYTGEEEYHINSDIVYGIVQYFISTGDKDFMKDYGVEILLDTAKFWESRVEYNKENDRYEISTVIGPDEFHEHVNNNVYTNYLAKWSLEKSIEYLNWLKNEDKNKLDILLKQLDIYEENINNWITIRDKLYIPKKGDIIEQFEGYFDLENIKISEHDENGMPKWPNGIKGNKLNTTQIIKQADIVQLLEMLPHEFSKEVKKKNYEYYEERTMNKSSLSPSMYTIVGLSVGDNKKAYNYFMKTVLADMEDNQGNSKEGLHAASTGGAWQSAIFGFGGVSVDRNGKLNIDPWIPEHWEALEFNLNWKGNRIYITVKKDSIEINSNINEDIIVKGKRYIISNGELLKVKI